jgi:hypothetical protein
MYAVRILGDSEDNIMGAGRETILHRNSDKRLSWSTIREELHPQ